MKKSILCHLVAVGCFSLLNSQNAYSSISNINQVTKENPVIAQKGKFAQLSFTPFTEVKKMVIEVGTKLPFDAITVTDVLADGSEVVVVDNFHLPDTGFHVVEALIVPNTSSSGAFRLYGRNGELTLARLELQSLSTEILMPEFDDISESIGLPQEVTYKYGGPSIGDIDNDGDYDFVLNNHNYVPPQIIINNGISTAIDETKLYKGPRDYHGSALGDYDNDGDLDVLIAMGGANGTNPSSYELNRNDGNGKFTLLSPSSSGIDKPSRGRSPRFIDFNKDGLLDLVLINARTNLPNYKLPQHHFYKNLGKEENYRFEWVEMGEIANTESERALVLDYDKDNIDDLLFLTPPSLWRGTGSSYENKSDLLPEDITAFWDIQAATAFDANNDGFDDIYLARGLPEYQLSNKSADFDAQAKTLNVRDKGEKGVTAIEFESDGSITLSDIDLTFRQYRDGYPIFLGLEATKVWMSASGFQTTQLHPKMKNGPKSLTLEKEQAMGFPEDRSKNGIYIGYVDGKWHMEWVRAKTIYWQVGFSLDNVENVVFKNWEPQNRNRQDYLLIFEDGKFIDRTEEWKLPTGGNHWGVTNGDFNNDGWQDLFIYRYGQLKERISDLLLLNTGTHFYPTTMHGAVNSGDTGHGDMGQAFDFDGDGLVDLLNGSNEKGQWYLYKNNTKNTPKALEIAVGYSPKNGIDPLGALVKFVISDGSQHTKRVGSAGEVFSQGVMNLIHFGLGNLDENDKVERVEVIWRNGEKVLINAPKSGRYDTNDSMVISYD